MTVPEVARAPGQPRPAMIDWVLVVLLSLLSGVVGVFGVFFLPTYIGSVPAPVSAPVIGVALAVIPRMSYRVTRRMISALAPVAVWFVVTVGLYLADNALYTGIPVAWRGWQFALLVGVGGLAAASSVGLVWGDHLSAESAARATTLRTRG